MRSFCLDYYLSQALGRPMSFAVPAPFLADKILPTYGFQPAKIHYLPNILARNTRPVQKFTKPTVIVVGRLDPIKRPWLAVALAEKFPTVDFIFLGENHFKGAGGWEAEALPANVQMLGHVDGEQKAQLMSSAWVLLNTSIHEGLPVTFQESLAWETPIISCVNPDQVTAHFGIFVGDANGTGLQILPKFEAALNTLLHDSDRREYLGKAGRIWIESTHNQANFLSVFHSLCQEMNLFL
ncbi:glycosyltransferase family 4 protein [Leptolyngbya sp. 'hensonii']|uniref:glycosyltransferase family 4 protein n=1 Tax=Leptolyngbya sp. 'hensonii' TaxID=1922337 RepID=UPI0015592F53|nr:glycosyltransferase family 4 protein [Leptolyngbya sp. 'hensonii']